MSPAMGKHQRHDGESDQEHNRHLLSPLQQDRRQDKKDTSEDEQCDDVGGAEDESL